MAEPSARSGFTLLETLLVLGLFAMLSVVLVGGSASLLKGTARSDPEDAILTLMQTVRRQAVEQSRILELTLDESNKQDDEITRYTWGDNQEQTLPHLDGVKVKLLPPEVVGAILLGGVAQENPLDKVRFYPDGTCDRVRLDVTRGEDRRVMDIDPLTCAPFPAKEIK
jgi:prepilin-type N-terminal cleavage/methylation domain-containing protein